MDMTIKLKWSKDVPHKAQHDDLLRRLYRKPSCPLRPDVSCPLYWDEDAEDRYITQVIVEKELPGGFGGARVLVVIPVEDEDAYQAKRVVKLGPRVMLEVERRNFKRFVQEYLLTAIATQKRFVVHDAMAAIEYVFIGGGMLEPVEDLITYYMGHSARKITKILNDLLLDHLGEYWYIQGRRVTEFAHEEYGAHLPPQVSLKLHHFSDDQLRPEGQTVLQNVKNYRPLEVDILLHNCNLVKVGELRQMGRLEVVRIKPWAATLVHRDETKVRIRVEYDRDSNIAQQMQNCHDVTVYGQVIATRPGLLEAVVRSAFSDCDEVQVSPDSDLVLADLGHGPYSNPLKLYPDLLDRTLEVHQSIIHGDLHPRNILIDRLGHPWLIDFGRVRKGHTLFDFIKLETYLRLDVLSRISDFSLTEYIEFEEALVDATCNGFQTTKKLANRNLRKALRVILSIRRSASRFHSDPSKYKSLATYFHCLLLYNLAVLKYSRRAVLGEEENTEEKKRQLRAAQLCFVAAAVQGRLLGGIN